MQRNGQKTRYKKSKDFFFNMDFPQKVFYGVFSTPLVEKRQSQKLKKREEKYLPTSFSAICQIYVAFPKKT
jgi:hypothetical protein